MPVNERIERHVTLVAVIDEVNAAQKKLHDRVQEARQQGNTWAEIGAALGTTRQAAQQRFGKADDRA